MKTFAITLSTLLIMLHMTMVPSHAKEHSVLIIGDSNTEFNFLPWALNEEAIKHHGWSGYGFVGLPFNTHFPWPLNATMKGNWTKHDMHNDHQRLTKGVPSPHGNWLTSNTPGDTLTIKFLGCDTFDIYTIDTDKGGTFDIIFDNEILKQVNTSGKDGSFNRHRVTFPYAPRRDGNTWMQRTITIKVTKGPVKLFGFDLHSKPKIATRTIVHRWGNGHATTQDYLNIPADVHKRALNQINPSTIVLLLGTNDHNIDNRSPKDFQANLTALIKRFKQAAPSASFLLVSTFDTNTKRAKTLLPTYCQQSYPNAAKATGVTYWDMGTWFGSFKDNEAKGFMRDNWHCDKEGGQAIAAKLWPQLTSLNKELLP